jgi:hypothetical protein
MQGAGGTGKRISDKTIKQGMKHPKAGPPHSGARRLSAARASTIMKSTSAAGAAVTTVQIELPEELALRAKEAGLLTPEAMESMLRERLRKEAGEALREMWAGMPLEELTPEVEQEIVEEVRAFRAERRKRTAR